MGGQLVGAADGEAVVLEIATEVGGLFANEECRFTLHLPECLRQELLLAKGVINLHRAHDGSWWSGIPHATALQHQFPGFNQISKGTVKVIHKVVLIEGCIREPEELQDHRELV